MLLNTDMGVINGLLTTVGLGKVPWLTDPRFSPNDGYHPGCLEGRRFFLYHLSGGSAENVPKDLYEAAEIDSAGKSKSFSITLPLISPTTLFLTIQAVISSLQVFDQAYFAKGGPGDSSSTMVFYIWQRTFPEDGYGIWNHPGSFCICFFVMIVTVTQMVLSKKWVFIIKPGRELKQS